jgi:hypothetical protein
MEILVRIFSQHSFLITLAVRLGRVITLVHNKVFWPVVFLSTEIALQDILDTSSITLLRIDGRARHVRYHGIPAAPWVLRVPQWVVLWCRLWEPDVTTVSSQMAALQRLSDILLDDNGATGGVDEP